MNPRRFAGFGLLAVVAAAVIAWQAGALDALGLGSETEQVQLEQTGQAQIVVSGAVGGEKTGLLEDPEIVAILQDTYGLTVEGRREGSLEMVRQPPGDQDFLWPSSEVALALYEDLNGPSDADNIFNSPMVVYSWNEVTEALVGAGVVQQPADGPANLDLAQLLTIIDEERQWADLGLPTIYGAVSVISTDPTKSNSGNMFSGLLANTLNEGQVATPESLAEDLPAIEQFYARLGFLEDSSGDLFDAFLQQGMGARPMIVGYESQLVEFGLENEQYRELVSEQVQILYPVPTVWSSHPLIPLTEEGERLREALQDPEIQRLAWERHGFRSGDVGAENDPADIDFPGVPATIDAVVPMPAPAVMQQIIDALAR